MIQYPKSMLIYYINKLKNKNHIIITIDAEKSFHRIQHFFLIKKTFNTIGIWGTYFNIYVIRDKPTVEIMTNSEKLKEVPLRLETSQGCLLSSFLFNLVLEVLATAVR